MICYRIKKFFFFLNKNKNFCICAIVETINTFLWYEIRNAEAYKWIIWNKNKKKEIKQKLYGLSSSENVCLKALHSLEVFEMFEDKQVKRAEKKSL